MFYCFLPGQHGQHVRGAKLDQASPLRRSAGGFNVWAVQARPDAAGKVLTTESCRFLTNHRDTPTHPRGAHTHAGCSHIPERTSREYSTSRYSFGITDSTGNIICLPPSESFCLSVLQCTVSNAGFNNRLAGRRQAIRRCLKSKTISLLYYFLLRRKTEAINPH